MSLQLIDVIYLISAVLFILGIKKLGSPATARVGNRYSMVGMAIAVFITLFNANIVSFTFIAIGVLIGAIVGTIAAKKVEMTSMPEMIALFNGCGGAASALVAISEYHRIAPTFEAFNFGTLILSVIIGCITVTGSIIAFAKLYEVMTGNPITFPGLQAVNALLGVAVLVLAVMVFKSGSFTSFYAIVAISLILGVMLVIPIGGADMPVVISLLNSYSGVAVSMTGFVLNNNALIIVGSLVGAAGLILTKIMCDAMNRSLANVIFGAFGGDDGPAGEGVAATGSVKAYTVEDAMIVMQNADSLVIVPGYGMAAAQAQHAVRELAELLEEEGVDVRYAIHPVAGRMPGHMNVLLAESDVPYDKLYAMEDINDDFAKTDAVLIIGANDVVNPAAKTNPASPIYGMPVLNIEEAKHVMVLKRSMKPGFAGIDNELFVYDNTMMIFGDAKETLNNMIRAVKEA